MSTRTVIRTVFIAVLGLLALALPGGASAAAHRAGAVVFSQSWVTSSGEGKETKEVEEGGLFADREGHGNQLTENPADTEPSFSADGRTIAFAREGHIYTVRPDGSGERRITSGVALDSRPQISPSGRIIVFERRTGEGALAHLYTVAIGGGTAKELAPDTAEDFEARFAPDGSKIVFVRRTTTGSRPNDDLYSVRPNGTGLTRLTSTTRVDEFDPRYFAGGIVFSRGNQSEGAAGYADIYTMKANGAKVAPLVEGVGSAYVEDVSPQGHTLIFRRDRGLWQKKIGPGKAKKVVELPDGSQTNSVFSSDGRSIATLVEEKGEQRVVAIDLVTGRRSQLAVAYDVEAGGKAEIGPVLDWQPVR